MHCNRDFPRIRLEVLNITTKASIRISALFSYYISISTVLTALESSTYERNTQIDRGMV
jgi:hypothetical protein